MRKTKEKSPNETDMSQTLCLCGSVYGAQIEVHQTGKKITTLKSPETIPAKVFQFLREFVSSPTISDSFGAQHTRRREFKNHLLQEHPELYSWLETNRLSYNHLQAILLTLHMYPQNRKTRKILRTLHEIIPDNSMIYDQLTNQEKIALTTKIATLVEKLYLLVGKQ